MAGVKLCSRGDFRPEDFCARCLVLAMNFFSSRNWYFPFLYQFLFPLHLHIWGFQKIKENRYINSISKTINSLINNKYKSINIQILNCHLHQYNDFPKMLLSNSKNKKLIIILLWLGIVTPYGIQNSIDAIFNLLIYALISNIRCKMVVHAACFLGNFVSALFINTIL